MTIHRLIKTTHEPKANALSKGQKLFNKLIKKIDQQRTQLQELQTAIPLYQLKHGTDYLPLQKSFDQHRTNFVFLLDSHTANKMFSKTDLQKIADIIVNVTTELLDNKDAAPELKELFNNYSGEDYDEKKELASTDLKAMMSTLFGAEVDGDKELDINDPDSMFKFMAEQAQQWHERDRQSEQHTNSKRKKSAKQLAKEEKLAQEEKNISQSIQMIYRKLASALHPDRELDPTERARKTALMQRVNVAYAARNLLQLLELQLEIEQIDENMVSTLSEDRLKHYNQILTEQLFELEMEVEQTGMVFKMRFQLDPNLKLVPDKLIRVLNQHIIGMQHAIHDIKLDLKEYSEPKALKSMLKNYLLSELSMPAYSDQLF